MDGWNTSFLLGRPIFRGENVSFREGMILSSLPGALKDGIPSLGWPDAERMHTAFQVGSLGKDLKIQMT